MAVGKAGPRGSVGGNLEYDLCRDCRDRLREKASLAKQSRREVGEGEAVMRGGDGR